MNKIKYLIAFIFFSFLVTLPLLNMNVHASSSTSYTMTINSKGNYVRTQDAYLPDQTITNLQLSGPEDLTIVDIDKDGNDDMLIIADTGNKKIIGYDLRLGTVTKGFTHSEFKTPRGVFVTKNNDIYVADTSAATVFRFDFDGNLIEKFGRPTSPSYGEAAFNPKKIAVDNRGNIYVYAEAVTDGIIQLSKSGEFLGYFTSNQVHLTPFDLLLDAFSTKTQQEQRRKERSPKTFSNLYIDKEGIVYTTTAGAVAPGLKKHNMQGGNILKGRVVTYEDTSDVYVDKNGIIYVSMNNGTIFVYSQEGEFIYNFGANNQSLGNAADISGLYTSLSSLAVDSEGRIWTLDDKKAFIQSFKPTEYANMIYSALDKFQTGDYEGSVEIWNEVFRLNQMSVLAHSNIGKNYYNQQEYAKAMVHFEIAGDRLGYSNAFWEVRNTWLQSYLGIFLVILFAVGNIYFVLKYVDRRTQILGGVRHYKKRFTDIKIVNDLLYIFRVMKHPLDSYYEIKKGHKGTILTATILYIITFVLYMTYTVGKGFIYQFVAVEDMDVNSIVLGFFAITLLFILCNYLVTSINDGEGTIKQIYMMFAYSLAPLMISTTLVAILSYGLTYNESFILSLIILVGFLWTGVNIFLGVGEIHNYTIWNTIKSIVITILFMLILAIVLIVIVMMWDQLYQFFESIIKEAIRNVTQ